MKNIILLIVLYCGSASVAQVKHDTLTLTAFTVNKSGQAVLAYTHLEDVGISYKIEGRKAGSPWTMLARRSAYPMLAIIKNKPVSATDTLTLELDSMRELRVLFMEPRLLKKVTKTITIP